MGNNFSTTFTPYYLPPLGFNYGSVTSVDSAMSDEEKIAKKRKEEAERIRKNVEEYTKAFELKMLKESQNSTLKYFEDLQIQSEKSLEQISNSKKKDGSARIDSGVKGWKRWLSNAGTSLINIGKSLAGFDKDGNWDIKKFGLNCALVAAGVALLFVPGGPLVLGALGAIGGIKGVIEGFNDLDKAERKKDQEKIDAAQQDICGNAIIGVLSMFGLKGLGAGFRTSITTAEKASCAAQRTGLAGKTVESISNFGRDVTVNAYKASLKPRANGLTPSFSKWKKWETQYSQKFTKYEETLNQQIQEVNDLIKTTSDSNKLAMLQEQRALLYKNHSEFKNFKNLKAKKQIDKLVAEKAKTSGQANIVRLGNYQVKKVITNGKTSKYVDIRRQKIPARDFIQFKKQMANLQKAYDKSFRDLVKARENMMRELAKDPVKNKAVLKKYIKGLPVKKRWWVPKNKHKWYPLTQDLMTIGGKQPSYLSGTITMPFVHPSANVTKLMALNIEPIHSGAMLLTMDMTPEEVQNQIAGLTQSIETFNNLREKFANAKTKEETENVINEFNQVLVSIQGSQEIAQA